MLTTYTALKTLHVLAAITWVGGAFLSQLFAIRANRAHEPGAFARLLGDIEFVGTRVFLPSSLLLVLTGFGMIGDGSLDFDLWIILGLVIWAMSAVSGAAFLGPESGRIRKIFESEGMDSPAAVARTKRIFIVSRIELFLLLAIVVVMVLKPGA